MEPGGGARVLISSTKPSSVDNSTEFKGSQGSFFSTTLVVVLWVGSVHFNFLSQGTWEHLRPKIIQRYLYSQGGLQAEGIFRITAGNSQEEYVREQSNRGIVPEGIDVHCLAGVIKSWFRELPSGVLDSLYADQVIQCEFEDDCVALVKFLLATEAALLDWSLNLMADVGEEEHRNKMNSRNIAMVFAPNMTKIHGLLNGVSWGILFPIRILFVRYLKVWPLHWIENGVELL